MYDEEIVSILDEIDIKEKKMLNDGREVAAEYIMLDPISYDALRFELGYTSDETIERYHGYTVTVTHSELDKCVRFV